MKVLSDILFDGNIIASNLPQANGGVYKALLINTEEGEDENKFVIGELPDVPTGFENPMTKRADIIVGDQDGEPVALEAPDDDKIHFLTVTNNDQNRKEINWVKKIFPGSISVAPKSLLGCRHTTSNLPAENIAVGEGLDIKVIHNVATLVKADTVYYFGENPGTVAPGTGINVTEFGEVALNRFLPISTVGMWTIKLDLTSVCNVGYEYWEYRVLDHKTLEFVVIVRNIFDKNKLVIAEHIPSMKITKHLGTYTYDDMSEAKFASEGVFNEETIKVSLVKVEDINSIYHNLKIENNLDRITAFNHAFNDFKIFTKIKVHTDEFSVPQL